MHEAVPDEYKPVVFQDGVRVPFPAATKKLRAPRMRHSSELANTHTQTVHRSHSSWASKSGSRSNEIGGLNPYASKSAGFATGSTMEPGQSAQQQQQQLALDSAITTRRSQSGALPLVMLALLPTPSHSVEAMSEHHGAWCTWQWGSSMHPGVHPAQ
mmetsp:Transcript_30241/g.66134  ORF Transcript_30241/g.66134 Transcript_30241/m.66134 type:complete len:157 (-) Transcript_30241:119-589(-)